MGVPPKTSIGLALLLCAALLSPLPSKSAEAPASTSPAPAAAPKPKLPPLPAPVRVGDSAPDFELTDLNGVNHRLSDYSAQGKIVVLEWFSPACPVCIDYYTASPDSPEAKPAMVATHDALGSDVVWLCINSSAPGKPGSDLTENKQALQDLAISFPLLMDFSGRIGQAYGARRTPHMMVIGSDGRLVYRGSCDEGGRDKPGTGRNFVIDAVNSAREGRLPLIIETQAVG